MATRYDDTASTSEDLALNINVLANDGSRASLVSAASRSTLGATVKINNSGTIRYEPTGAESIQALSAGETATDTFTYVFQSGGRRTTAEVTVTVTGTNDRPVFAASGSATVAEAENTTGSTAFITAAGALAFRDVDLSDVGHTASVMSVVATGATSELPDNASLLRLLTLPSVTKQAGSSSGVVNWSFSESDAVFDYLPAGQAVTLAYTVAVNDGDGGAATQFVNITIAGSNDGPVAAADVANGYENRTLTIDVLDNDEDVDAGAVRLLVSGSAPDSKGTVSVVDGKLVYDPGISFEHLAEGDEEKVTLSYTMEDEHGAQSSSTVEVTITGREQDTVDFDDIVPVPTVIQDGYHGFDWFGYDSSGNAISNFYLGYEPPGIELGGIDSQFVQNGVKNNESDTSTIERSDGSEFDIESLDIGQINNNGTNYQATSVTFQGLLDGDEMFRKTVSLEGMPWDGTVSADYKHVQLDFAGIDQLNIISTGNAPSGAGQWAIDNIEFYI